MSLRVNCITAFCITLSAFAEPGQIANSIGMKLVRIAPGSFLMGQDGSAADYNVKKHAEKSDDGREMERRREILRMAFREREESKGVAPGFTHQNYSVADSVGERPLRGAKRLTSNV